MGELKSAWEIAQEKADKLGKLSADEQRKQIEKRCASIGKALAAKYLDGRLEAQYLEIELNKYSMEDKDLISQTILGQMVEELELGKGPALERILEGISRMAKPDGAIESIASIKELLQEYRQAELDNRNNIEETGREVLRQLGISGTAIDQINSLAGTSWQQAVDEVVRPFKERLHRLKQELASNATL